MEVAFGSIRSVLVVQSTIASFMENHMIRLKLWRLQHGLTQEHAARLLGMGESTFALLESGRLRPTAQQLETLSHHFGAQTESLFKAVQERVEVTP